MPAIHMAGHGSERPDTAPAGTTFLDLDSRAEYVSDGKRWVHTRSEPLSADDVRHLTQAIERLRVEVAALRLGMVAAGTCAELDLADVPPEA